MQIDQELMYFMSMYSRSAVMPGMLQHPGTAVDLTTAVHGLTRQRRRCSKCICHSDRESSPCISRREFSLSAGSALLTACAPGQHGSAEAAETTPATKAAAAAFCGVTPRVPTWIFSTPWQEKLVDFRGLKTWTRAIGKQPKRKGFFGKRTDRYKLPLLVLHGGPGLPSQYLESVELLAGSERLVAFYDQMCNWRAVCHKLLSTTSRALQEAMQTLAGRGMLWDLKLAGCGNSFRASGLKGPEPAEMSLDLYLDELAAVRNALSLEQCHLMGHGWGGMLALAHLLRSGGDAQGVASVTLVSTAPSWAAAVADRSRRAEELEPAQRDQLLQQPAGTSTPEYAAAEAAFRQRFLTRASAAQCIDTAERGRSEAVREALAGGSLFKVGGSLMDWDMTQQLGSIHQPALVLQGEQDVVLPETGQQLAAGLRTQLVTLPNSGSYVHIDAYQDCLTKIKEHLDQHDP